MSQLYGGRVIQSDDCTGPSLNLINRTVPQSNVTEPNKSNVVTVTVFGNLCVEKDTTDRVCPSSRLSYRFLTTFLPENQRLSLAKSCLWWKKISATASPPDGKVYPPYRHACLGAAAPAFCVKSRQCGGDFRSVWIPIGRELANCGFYASSPGSSSLQRCFALSERPSAENWWTACGVNAASLYERGYLLLLIGLDLDRNLCRDSAFSHCETDLWIWVLRFQFWYVCRYSPNIQVWNVCISTRVGMSTSQMIQYESRCFTTSYKAYR